MILALVIIWGDYIANSKKAREVICCGLLVLLAGLAIAFPSSEAVTVANLLFAFVFTVFCIFWEINKNKLPRRLRAARIAWEMGYSSSRAWSWGKNVVK